MLRKQRGPEIRAMTMIRERLGRHLAAVVLRLPRHLRVRDANLVQVHPRQPALAESDLPKDLFRNPTELRPDALGQECAAIGGLQPSAGALSPLEGT